MKRTTAALAVLLCMCAAAESHAGASFSRLLAEANRYTLRSWYPNAFRDGLTDFGEPTVRPAASQALALATAVETGMYTGAGRRHARRVATAVLAELARTHDRWGGEWQSAMWASQAGLAGLLMRARLPHSVRASMRSMVAEEANRFVGYEPPCYRVGRSVLLPGDTKAEENTWNAQILAVALALLPRNPNDGAWRHANRRLVATGLARPQDATGPYRRLLRGCSNVNGDYSVTNHGIRDHPDYAAAVLVHTGFQAILTGGRPARFALLNHRGIYRRLTRSYMADGSIRVDDPFMEARSPFAFALADLQARAFGYGGRRAARWQRIHLRRTLSQPLGGGAAPYGEAWNRGLVSSAAATGVLLRGRCGDCRALR